ncbi:hypothetical protein SY88_21930 [Clostridiales bacterium PH28_bin88]|nr:hypothetical protein SY88_21930 [Clostridiales bacterium PH28_bin88]
MGELLHHMLERNARKYPALPALRYPPADRTVTWGQLNARANALARRLVQAGVEKDRKVALFIPNRPEFVIAFFAVLKAGGVVVPVNVRLTAGEVAYILENSDSVGIIYDPALEKVAQEAATQSGNQVFMISTGELSDTDSNGDMGIPASLDDTAEILYTSGTTGKPKGVVLTHNAVHSVASMMAYFTRIDFGDRTLLLMPLTHSAPLNLFMLAGVYAGATGVLGDFMPQTMLDYTQNEKATHFFGAPVAYLLASRLPNFDSYDLSSAKYWVYGGAPMAKEAVQLVQAKFPGRLMGVYGLTECGPNGMALFQEEHAAKAGSIGWRGTVNTEIRVVDADGNDVPPGGAGEIIIHSLSNMTGYYKNAEATRETLKDDWVWTGDIARKDEDDYVWILDRKKDVIITGGVNVYPKEVEDVLALHPAVADSAVVGVPHPDWGETVTAVIVAKPGSSPTAEDVKNFCSQRLADFKVPRVVHFVETVPRNASGKILKHVLREHYRAG